MIVYILSYVFDYDGSDIEGVFATLEDAMAVHPEGWLARGEGCWWSRDGASRYVITAHPVQGGPK